MVDIVRVRNPAALVIPEIEQLVEAAFENVTCKAARNYLPGASSQTISVRFGDDSVDALDLNADGAGNRRYGGAYASTLEVVEYMP